ncbi:MAG: hypothetical protein Q7T56_19650 [Nocardioidaceae bacterium]|nr:hypothetical protein [Nocardioidaceae bacterium]
MPKQTNDDNNSNNSPYKSVRRQARGTASRPTPRARKRGPERRISIRSELRREPDVQKIARAVIALAIAQAEADAAAEQEQSRE